MHRSGTPWARPSMVLVRSAQDATAAERVHLRLCQSSGWSVCFPVGAFWLMGGSACHDDAHGAFMTLPPYTRIREGETRQLGGVVRGGPLRYEMLSGSQHCFACKHNKKGCIVS